MPPSLLLLSPPARRLLALLPLLLTCTAVHAQGHGQGQGQGQGQGNRPAMNPSMNMPMPRGNGMGNGNSMGMGNGMGNGMGMGMGLQRDPPGLLKQQNWMQPGNSGNVGKAANGARAANAANRGDTDETGEGASLQQSRARTVKNLLRVYRDVIEADPRGEPVLRRQLLAWSPPAAVLEAARAEGFSVLGKRVLGGLGETLVTLGVPERYSTEEALARLQALDPGGSHDFNHLYISSGQSGKPSATGQRAARPAAAGPVRVGLVDGGVDSTHQAFQKAAIRRWGCNGRVVPSAHGTAVASLLIGNADRFHGVSPGARLYAADAYCGSETGGAVDQIIEALAWLAREQVPVVNVSLVGPPNQMLERAVQAMLKRGHLLIAAVGNDGPAAPPLYPASYPGVIGVSGADAQRRILPEAARGPQVMFAAPGSQMLAAAVGPQPYGVVRGTSFAAPIVAAMLAQSMRTPDLAAGRSAVAKLAARAQRMSSGERSPEAGYGLVGEAFRIAPEARP
ncbi:Major intracellular serine protease precursor [Janthinobacterium lividum]|uniref:S8 family serine peptidase n=1 Tax=Janthinobacterium lividum TaxID=29581 RepID=UPI000DFA0453|nr:S8 family serine peptidase [Janthinobacterium lividum]STR23404.1 Major intracellular serine protease precursor [Janthinobacterium lividum]